MDARARARARGDNVCPCGLHFDHSTAGHTYRRRLHGPCCRHHPADRPNHQLAGRHPALSHPPQWQTTSIPTTPSVSHKPPPASEPASDITQPRHVVVVCAGTHSAVRAARRVGRIPPRTAPTGVRDGGWAAEPGNCECIIVVLCLAVPTVVRSRSRRLSGRPGQRQRQRCRVARAPRKGSCGRFTWRRAGGRAGGISALGCLDCPPGRASREGGFAVLVLISRARATRWAMLAKRRRRGRTMMEKVGKLV